MAIVDLTFSRPEFLWYLLAVPFLFITHFIFLYRTQRKAIQFANFEALQRVSKGKLLTKNMTILVLRILIIACLILAISQATVWYTTKSNTNDFVIALDISASMAAQDIEPNRMEAAKQAALLFVDTIRSRAKIGLVTFSGVPFVVTIPTDDRKVLKEAISLIDIEHAGGTDIGGAIITGTNLLLPSAKGRSVILISDGSNTAGVFTENPVQKGINYATKNHVLVYTIGIGTQSGPIGYLPEVYNISASFNDQELLSIANQTVASYYRAQNAEQLQSAYADISRKSEDAILPFDLSYGLLLICMTLIFIEWGLINTKFRNIP